VCVHARVCVSVCLSILRCCVCRSVSLCVLSLAEIPLPFRRSKSQGISAVCCCSAMQCVAVCCSVLQIVGRVCVRFVFLHYLFACCNVCAAICCSVLQCDVVYCSMLQCVTVLCSMLQCVAVSHLPRTRKHNFSLAKTKRSSATLHGPAPDGPNTSHYYRQHLVQKSTLSVLMFADLPGQSFHVWHFLDTADCR